MTAKKQKEMKLQQWRQMKERLEYVWTYMRMNYGGEAEICAELRRAGHLTTEDECAFYIEYLQAHRSEIQDGATFIEVVNSMYRLLWEEEPPTIPPEEKIPPIQPEYKPVQEYQSRALFLYLLTCRMEMMRDLLDRHPERFEKAGWEREWVEIGFDSEYVRIMYGILSDERNAGLSISELSRKAYRILYVGKRKIYNSKEGTGKMYSCDVLDLKLVEMECKTWCEDKLKQWLQDIEIEEKQRKGETVE